MRHHEQEVDEHERVGVFDDVAGGLGGSSRESLCMCRRRLGGLGVATKTRVMVLVRATPFV